MPKISEMDLDYAPYVNSDKNIIVISDGSDNDGVGAAFAAWKEFGDKAEYTFYKHEGDAKEIKSLIKNKDVILSDLSLNYPFIKNVSGLAKSVVVIDHHETSKEAYQKAAEELSNVDVVYTKEKSAARLAWEYFHSEDNVPALVKYIEDRDLWQFDLEKSDGINLYLDTLEPTFESWNELAELTDEAFFKKMSMRGEPMREYRDNLLDSIIGNVNKVSIEDFLVGYVNCGAYDLYSSLGHRTLKNKPELDAALMWQVDEQASTEDTVMAKGSMRAREEDEDVIHVGELCSRVSGGNGGGHQGAGGFNMPLSALFEVLNIQ